MSKGVAILGAGVSGLTAARWALQYGFKPVIFEAQDQIGGLWRFKPQQTEFSTVMKTTVINTSKEVSAYSDFPPDKKDPNYMHNSKLLRYLKDYADHHKVTPHVRFNHRVSNVKRADNYKETGKWVVDYTDDKGKEHTQVFDAVCVCVGHHAHPNMVKFPGQEGFTGEFIHSKSYKTHYGYDDKNVVVVGIGNSGVDVACELSRVAKQVYLVSRRGAWLVPKVGPNGIPGDMWLLTRYHNMLMWAVPGWFTNYFQNVANSNIDHDIYNLKPKHSIFAQHPTISDDLSSKILDGRVLIKPNIDKFVGNDIHFVDGTVVKDVDSVVACTGYRFDLPFIENGNLIKVKDNSVQFYKMIFPVEENLADKNTLGFIGYIQPYSSIMPVSEMHARLFFAVQTGQVDLPSPRIMKVEAEKVARERSERFVESTRHTIQVDYTPHMDELATMLGCKPNLLKYFFTDYQLWKKLMFQANVSYGYRLDGPDKWEGAREAIMSVDQRRIAATKHNEDHLVSYS